MEETKYCSNKNCKENNPQPLSNFHKDKTTKDGYKCRCKSCLLAYAKEYSDKNRELRAQKQREYYKCHGDIQRKASNNWKKNNKEKVKEYTHKWYESNKEHKSDYYKTYSQSNKEIILEKSRRQRNKKYHIIDTFSEKDFQNKLVLENNKCFYCKCDLNSENMTRDHYIALSNGGSDKIENIVPCCSKCNSKKSNKSPEEYLKIIGNHDPSINLNG